MDKTQKQIGPFTLYIFQAYPSSGTDGPPYTCNINMEWISGRGKNTAEAEADGRRQLAEALRAALKDLERA